MSIEKGWVKNGLLVLTIVGLIISNIWSFTNVISDNEKFHEATAKTLVQQDKRIEKLEEVSVNNYKIQQEIRFNLRNHIISQGGVYLDGAK